MAHYSFTNGSTTDESASGNDLMDSGATQTKDRHNSPAAAYHFGGSAHMECPNPLGLDFGSDDFSISVWVTLKNPSDEVAEQRI